MNPTLLFGSIHPEISTESVGEYLAELSAVLKDRAGIQIHLEPLKASELTIIDSLAALDFSGTCDALIDLCVQHYFQHRCVVLCHLKHRVANLALADDGKAEWGRAYPNRCAFVYKEHKEIIWHESLHALGAEDCYSEIYGRVNVEPTCGLASCIMRYDPSAENGKWPFLCEKNLDRIRGTIARDPEMAAIRKQNPTKYRGRTGVLSAWAAAIQLEFDKCSNDVT